MRHILIYSMTLGMNMTKNKYTYEIVKRSGDIALLHGVDIYGSTTWEVWKIRQTKRDRVFPSGNVVPAGSDYGPSNEDWGRYGWTGVDEEDARIKFRALVSGDTRCIRELKGELV